MHELQNKLLLYQLESTKKAATSVSPSIDHPLIFRVARPTNSGESDMATEEHFNVMNFPPSPPFLPTVSSVPPHPRSPSSSNSMVVYQGSGQSSMDNPLQNRQQSVSMAAPTNIEEWDMATEEYLIYLNSPSPSSNSMVSYFQVSGQSSMDHPLPDRQQRPANSGDQSDMATEEHFDVTSLLNLPQWSPPRSPCSSANSMVVYQQGSGRSSVDFVDRPLYIAGDMALWRQQLLQLWMDASDELGPRGGIMSINKKENLPQSLECLGISLLHLYVEDKFDTLLYWPGESSWVEIFRYLLYATMKLLQGGGLLWAFGCNDLGRNMYGVFANQRFTMGMWRIGPREWAAKIRYQRLSLESPFYVDERGRHCHSAGIDYRIAQVVLEDARLNFPGHLQDFHNAVAIVAAPRKDPDEDDIFNVAIDDDRRLNIFFIDPWQFGPTPNQDEDFVNGEVEGTEEAEIAESQLNLGPSRKRQRKEKTPTGERGNKKSTRVKNVIPLEKILQVKERSLKGAAEFLKVSRYALKRACRKHGINRWPPRNEHRTSAIVDQEGIPEPSDNSCNDEVETVGMGGVGTGEGAVKEGELNCGSSDKGERNEKTPQGERANNETAGVRIEIPLEEILKYKKMCRKDAATHLQVSESTLKRICRGYNISRWSPRELNKLIGQSHPTESPLDVDQEQIHQLNCDTELRSNQASIETNSVTVKAKYETFTIKFRLSRPWQMVELEEKVKMRLRLEVGTYHTEYKDENGELILISCDDDLKDCIPNSSPMGTCSIELFLRQSSS